MHSEFLGEIRCQVFEVSPHKDKTIRFKGAIWVEDEGYHIVRFNGSYGMFHIDSWRMNLNNGEWMPAVVYSEEFDSTKPQTRGPKLKAQTRIWGYKLGTAGPDSEFTDIQVDPDTAKDSSEKPDKSPLDIQRSLAAQGGRQRHPEARRTWIDRSSGRSRQGRANRHQQS